VCPFQPNHRGGGVAIVHGHWALSNLALKVLVTQKGDI